MDGSQTSRHVLIDTNIEWPNGLTIDYKDRQLYWVDAKLHFIHACNLDGTNRRVVMSGSSSLQYPYALTLFEDTLFWTDWENNAIHSCNKHNGSDIQVVQNRIYSPMDIHVYDSSRQPIGEYL